MLRSPPLPAVWADSLVWRSAQPLTNLVSEPVSLSGKKQQSQRQALSPPTEARAEAVVLLAEQNAIPSDMQEGAEGADHPWCAITLLSSVSPPPRGRDVCETDPPGGPVQPGLAAGE
ncbi:hypothetical protein COCON_G00018330 [Conger conger]|uniref:Uncharacterized protein n=1 Tax=Conger conger TaxID=82655 RepID=A0A9Q1E3Z7_CONCO|nr:hypothetical protein COCON_G00018330 [Conger conger]